MNNPTSRKINTQEDAEYTKAETKRRAEAALIRALNTPPKPHKPLKEAKVATVKKDRRS